ncbi:hypothetical protein OSTOST_22461 [Ostertagia ostertagi]
MPYFPFWIWVAIIATVADAGKILVYSPSISYSHLISNGRIADALVKAGHDVGFSLEQNLIVYGTATQCASEAQLAIKFKAILLGSETKDAETTVSEEKCKENQKTWNRGNSFPVAVARRVDASSHRPQQEKKENAR